MRHRDTTDYPICPQSGKRGYPTYTFAAKKAKHGNGAKNRHDHISPYRCKSCGCWHIANAMATSRPIRLDYQRKKAAAAEREWA